MSKELDKELGDVLDQEISKAIDKAEMKIDRKKGSISMEFSLEEDVLKNKVKEVIFRNLKNKINDNKDSD